MKKNESNQKGATSRLSHFDILKEITYKVKE